MQISFDKINKSATMIDVRSLSEYEDFHYPGSINVPRLTLLKNPDGFLNKEACYYLICQRGEVSLSCAKILNALGYNCYSVTGGINQYKTTLGK